jgi:hypothetical protein
MTPDEYMAEIFRISKEAERQIEKYLARATREHQKNLEIIRRKRIQSPTPKEK